MKRLHIFKPGKHTAANGVTLNFSAEQLQATASAYDRRKHEAPIVVGHPKQDLPAYGWVQSLGFADGDLSATPYQVDPQFNELVRDGRYKQISASFYTPDAPANPVPGVYYLRHVGFLGAQPPAVKGLKPVEFADKGEGVIEFADLDDMTNAGLWRGLRDWLIGKFGLDEADRVLPDYQITALATAAALEPDDALDPDDSTAAAPAYSENHQGAITMLTPAEIAAREAALTTREATLNATAAAQAQRNIEFAERDKTAKAAEATLQRVSIVAFADGLVTAGKLLPAEKAGAIEFMAALPAETVVEFGEGDKKIKQPAGAWFKSFLEHLPPRVEFAEIGRAAIEAGSVNFAAPAGYTVDPERLAIHGKATAYAAKNKVDYITAVQAVSN